MTGRLNPRRYDLGELRDAVHTPPHSRTADQPTEDHTAVSKTADGDHRSHRAPAERDRRQRPGEALQRPNDHAVDVERVTPETDPETTDEVESYLRSRHQRRRDKRGSPDRGAGRAHKAHRAQSHPNTDRAWSHPNAASAPTQREQPQRGATKLRAEPHRTQSTASLLAELSHTKISKPYLDRLPDAYSTQLEIFEWIDGLLITAGYEETVSALEYYESIGWLSERSRKELIEMANGLSPPETPKRSLGTADHRESLVYVARLAHRRAD